MTLDRFPRRTIGALLAMALAAGTAHASPAGFAFLEVPAGARASAMGGAFCSVAEGVEAAYANVAGLEQVKGVEIVASHYEYFQKLRHDQFAVATRLLGGGMSGSVRALYSEPIDERDELGNLIGSFGAHDLEFALGYGRALGGGFTGGAAAKLVRERIANLAAMTWAMDFGAAWQPAGLPGVRFGATAQNLGPAAAYTFGGQDGEPVPLPAAVQAGVSWARSMSGSLALRGALEGRMSRGRRTVGILGGELEAPGVGASLRAGLRVNDDAASFSVGAGYALQALHLDYAFVPFRYDLGDTHRFSLSARF